MLKLCLTGKYPEDPARINGGVAYIIHLLAQSFAERGDIELHVVAPVKGVRGHRVLDRPGFKLHCVGSPQTRVIPRMLTDSFRIAKTLHDVRPDVIHSHYSVTTNAAVQARCSVIHTIHGIISQELAYFRGTERWIYALYDIAERKAISRANAIIAVARYGLEACRKWIHAPGYVVFPPVHDMFFEAKPACSSPSILYVGAICRRKNLLELLNALALIREHVPDVRLDVCGSATEDAYSSEVKNYVERHGLDRNVNFAGLVDSATVLNMLRKAACFCLPSKQETAPVVVAQAMAAGRPVVASPAGGTTEMVRDGQTGFIVGHGNTGELARRLLTLLDNRTLGEQMGQAGREIARTMFDRRKVADAIVEVCSSVTADGPAWSRRTIA